MPTRSRTELSRLVDTGFRTDPTVELTDKQWSLIEDLFPWEPPAPQGGRPKAKPRACFNGIMWVLRTGARWKDLPEKYPPKSTCHDRLKEWSESGLFDQALERLLRALEESEILDLTETFADGTFASAKKGVNRLDRHAVAKELRL